MDTAILQCLPDPYLLMTRAGQFVQANPAVVDLTYRSAAEWQKSARSSVLRFDRPVDNERLLQYMKAPVNLPWQAPAWCLRKDNTWLPIHLWVTHGKGTLSGYLLLRLTQRKQKMQGVAIENTMDGVALLDKEGKYYYLNDAHVKLFGYDKEEELLGKTWQAIYQPHEIERIEEDVFRQLEERGTFRGETVGCTKDGAPVYQEITLTALEDGGLVCVCRDISERKQFQAELQKLALVARHTDALVVITDCEGCVEWVNESFTANTGYTLNDMKGKKPGHVLQGPDTDPNTVKAIRKALDGQQSYEGEILNYTKTGDPYWIFMSINPLFHAGELRQYIAVQTIITEIREAKVRMEQALQKERELNESKSKFISLTSHEFRTPMTGIQLSADLIARYVEKVDVPSLRTVMKQQVTRISDEVDHMKEVLDNILNLGRIEAGKIEVELKPVVLHTLVQQLLDEYLAVNFPGRTLDFNWEGPPRQIALDERLMGHIVRNLVANALKYSADDVVPVVQIAYASSAVQLIVADKGIGIPEKDIPHLFTSFFRAENVGTRKGTGLGLVLVKHFTACLGGTINVASEVGQGTTFTLRFPYAR